MTNGYLKWPRPFSPVITKGQLISKGLFGILNSSKKWTKKFNLTTILWCLRSTCFRLFFGRIWRHQKRHFEINWALKSLLCNLSNFILSSSFFEFWRLWLWLRLVCRIYTIWIFFDTTINQPFLFLFLNVRFWTTAGNIHLEPQLLHYSKWQKMDEAWPH